MCAQWVEPALEIHRDQYAQQAQRVLDKIEKEGPATGEGQFVVFTEKMQKEYGISRFGTVQYVDGVTVYKAGPQRITKAQMDAQVILPNLVPYMEDYVDGSVEKSLDKYIPSRIALEREEKEKGIATLSFLESWLFAYRPTIICIDPSRGTLYRVLEASRNVQIVLTNPDPTWTRKIRDEFLSAFRGKALAFSFVDKDKIVDQVHCLCYHGANGMKLQIDHPFSVALEPNVYSQEMRKAGLIVEETSPNMYRMTYKRKKELRSYNFPKYSGWYRLDPETIRANSKVRGDAYFVASSFNPAALGVTARPKPARVVGEMMSYNVLPPYAPCDGFSVSQDDQYVYDVAGVMTCMSRREFTSQYARMKGKQLAPLVEYGLWVASPYATEFSYMGQRSYGRVTVIETESMSFKAYQYKSQIQGKSRSNYLASAFVVGDFTGRKVTPFEAFGTAIEVETYTDPGNHVRHPMIEALSTRKAMVFDSFSRLLANLHYIAHWCMESVSSAIISEVPPEPLSEATVTVSLGGDPDECEVTNHTGSDVSKSLRAKIIDYYEEDNRAKSLQMLMDHFPTKTLHEIKMVLRYIPHAFPVPSLTEYKNSIMVETSVFWMLSMDDIHFVAQGGTGLGSYERGMLLKNDILMGELKFTDDEDIDVSQQEEFILSLGCEKLSTQTRSEGVCRQYRLI